MSWQGCTGQLDPAWNPQTDQETITTATPEYGDPTVIPNADKD